jgi:hypothetical protein
VKVTAVPVHFTEIYAGVEAYIHSFLSSTLDRGEWLASRFSRHTSRSTAFCRRLCKQSCRSERFKENDNVYMCQELNPDPMVALITTKSLFDRSISQDITYILNWSRSLPFYYFPAKHSPHPHTCHWTLCKLCSLYNVGMLGE